MPERELVLVIGGRPVQNQIMEKRLQRTQATLVAGDQDAQRICPNRPDEPGLLRCLDAHLMPGTVFGEPSNAFTSTPINFSNNGARLPREPTTLPHPAFEDPKSFIFPVPAVGVNSTNSTLGEWIKN
jgi:hypothetical protein